MATWRELKPPQDVPYMPTFPVHQSCAASQAMTSQMSACSCAWYSSSAIPSEEPVPRRSSRQTAKPPSSQSRSYSLAYDAVRSSMRYGSASRIAGAGQVIGEEEARREPRPVLHRDPDVPVLHARSILGRSTIARAWISG